MQRKLVAKVGQTPSVLNSGTDCGDATDVSPLDCRAFTPTAVAVFRRLVEVGSHVNQDASVNGGAV